MDDLSGRMRSPSLPNSAVDTNALRCVRAASNPLQMLFAGVDHVCGILLLFGLSFMCCTPRGTLQQMKLITASGLVERLKVNGSLARAAIRELEEKGLIRKVDAHHAQVIYTRATNVEE